MHLFFRAMFALGAAFAVASIAGALEPETLHGEFQLAGPLDHKGSPGEGKSHLYISLTDHKELIPDYKQLPLPIRKLIP